VEKSAFLNPPSGGGGKDFRRACVTMGPQKVGKKGLQGPLEKGKLRGF